MIGLVKFVLNRFPKIFHCEVILSDGLIHIIFFPESSNRYSNDVRNISGPSPDLRIESKCEETQPELC